MHDDDSVAGQIDAGVIFGDARIIPRRDLSKIDVGQHVGAETKIGDAGHVEDGHNRAQHGGNVDELDLGRGQGLIGHGHVGGTKVHNAVRHLLDAAAGSDGLKVYFDARMRGAVLREPLGVDGQRKGSTRPGDLLGLSHA